MDDEFNEDNVPDAPLFSDAPVTETATETAEEKPADEGTATEEKTDTDTTKEEVKPEGTEQPAEDAVKPATEQKAETDEQAAQRQANADAAARRVMERQQTKQATEQAITESYAPKSQEDLYQENLDAGMTEELAAVRAESQALREEMQFNQQRTQIAELNAGMQAEAVNALNDFPIFNPDSKEYDKDFANRVQAAYQRDSNIQTDENGIILHAERPLYDYYKEKVDDYNRGLERGRQQSQNDNLDMLSRTEDIGGSTSTSKGSETLEEMGERLADQPLF